MASVLCQGRYNNQVQGHQQKRCWPPSQKLKQSQYTLSFRESRGSSLRSTLRQHGHAAGLQPVASFHTMSAI